MSSTYNPKINNQITAPKIRVIDENGKNLGVFDRDKALSLAKPELGLDLIEIAPNANPPVARLMSFDKYRYQKAKEERKERRAQKGNLLKRIQISARSAQNDLLVKIRQLEKFLAEGHQVEIYMRLVGRERNNKDWAHQKLNDFLKMINVEYKIVIEPKFGGSGLVAQIAKK